MKLNRAAHLRLGRHGERAAERLLKSKGYTILARNWRVKSGELDIVARDGAAIVFVEVKTLRKMTAFRPGDNLSLRQMNRNYRAARYFMRAIGHPGIRCRFDLIEVVAGFWTVRSIRQKRNYLPPLEPETGSDD